MLKYSYIWICEILRGFTWTGTDYKFYIENGKWHDGIIVGKRLLLSASFFGVFVLFCFLEVWSLDNATHGILLLACLLFFKKKNLCQTELPISCSPWNFPWVTDLFRQCGITTLVFQVRAKILQCCNKCLAEKCSPKGRREKFASIYLHFTPLVLYLDFYNMLALALCSNCYSHWYFRKAGTLVPNYSNNNLWWQCQQSCVS